MVSGCLTAIITIIWSIISISLHHTHVWVQKYSSRAGIRFTDKVLREGLLHLKKKNLLAHQTFYLKDISCPLCEIPHDEVLLFISQPARTSPGVVQHEMPWKPVNYGWPAESTIINWLSWQDKSKQFKSFPSFKWGEGGSKAWCTLNTKHRKNCECKVTSLTVSC